MTKKDFRLLLICIFMRYNKAFIFFHDMNEGVMHFLLVNPSLVGVHHPGDLA